MRPLKLFGDKGGYALRQLSPVPLFLCVLFHRCLGGFAPGDDFLFYSPAVAAVLADGLGMNR